MTLTPLMTPLDGGELGFQVKNQLAHADSTTIDFLLRKNRSDFGEHLIKH